MHKQNIVHPVSAGFTLIEVLVSMVIIAVGFIGLASLMVNMVGNASEPLTRHAAHRTASNLLERISQNEKGARAGLYVYDSAIPLVIDTSLPEGLQASEDLQEFKAALERISKVDVDKLGTGALRMRASVQALANRANNDLWQVMIFWTTHKDPAFDADVEYKCESSGKSASCISIATRTHL